MAHDPSDTRLRRSVLGKADPPAGTVIGADTILPPLPVERGLVRGSSNPANELNAQQVYEDKADAPKPNKPAGEHEVFANLRSTK